jgi:transcriptional regulator with GAF, ATPase, and Fis domain
MLAFRSPLVGDSPAIDNVFKTIEKISQTDSTVLITGESGVGKELIARAIHESSTRASRPMVVINCGAIPAELLEAELFGHVKGAFTGASQNRIGRFEAATGGTLFLDEVGELPSDSPV